MKGFRFRLEPVLSLREQREESLQSRLAESTRALERDVARLQQIDREIQRQMVHLAETYGGGALDLDEISRDNSYLHSLEQQRAHQKAVIAERTGQVEADRAAVLQASKEKKTLEKLRENMLGAFSQQVDRRENGATEEIASVRHLLRRRAADLASIPAADEG